MPNSTLISKVLIGSFDKKTFLLSSAYLSRFAVKVLLNYRSIISMSRKNFTEREKRELLSIVDKYKTIIENKSTNAVTVEMKNVTWEKIAQEYNSSAENPRTAKQLNTSYQNLKRLTRQKTANENNQNYMEKKYQIDIKKFKKDKAEDKKAIMATGGGNFTPQLSEVGAKMLALMGDQLKPLYNSCDSAADYFKKDENVNEENNNNDVIVDITQEFDSYDFDGITEVCVDPPLEEGRVSRVPPKTQKRPLLSKRSPSHSRQHIQQKKKKNVQSINIIKKTFYKKKLECALLEKRTSLINYKIAIKKEKLIDLELKIKEFELVHNNIITE